MSKKSFTEMYGSECMQIRRATSYVIFVALHMKKTEIKTNYFHIIIQLFPIIYPLLAFSVLTITIFSLNAKFYSSSLFIGCLLDSKARRFGS